MIENGRMQINRGNREAETGRRRLLPALIVLAPCLLMAALAHLAEAGQSPAKKATQSAKKAAGQKAAGKKPAAKKPEAKKPEAKASAAPKLPPLRTPEDKLAMLEKIRLSFPARKTGGDVVFEPHDVDRELAARIPLAREEYAPIIGDEGFIRRVYLDLTGELPDPSAVTRFVQDTSPTKRAKLIDELLETPEYARHWAHYWTNVVFYSAPVKRGRKVNPEALEKWFAAEFEQNTSWDRVVCELISATPRFNKAKEGNEWGQNYGPNNFALAYDNDPSEIASQTARLFMGISLGCAECHDHPFDRWKREQFHELTAFFAPGKYYMPGQYDPSQKSLVEAQFLLGEKPPEGLKPDALRVAVAAYLVYNPDNYWFARAYVNRIWNELLGEGFYAVDSLGPDKECVYPLVINRLAAVFRYRSFNVKWVFRTIMNSQTYQREIRTAKSPSEIFTAVRPARLRPDQVVNSVEHVVGSLPQRPRRALAETFDADPSVPQESLEGSLQQALLLMNNPQLQNGLSKSKLKADALSAKSEEQLLHKLYLGVLARQATPAELSRGKDYLRKTPNRSEAVDDLLWVLVNSTEFLTKR